MGGDWQEDPGSGCLQDTWSIPYITLMKSLASPSPFGVEYIISMWKINVEDLIFTEFPSRWYSVSLSFISLISLFLLLNSFNPHAPTLECVNIVKAET